MSAFYNSLDTHFMDFTDFHISLKDFDIKPKLKYGSLKMKTTLSKDDSEKQIRKWEYLS